MDSFAVRHVGMCRVEGCWRQIPYPSRKRAEQARDEWEAVGITYARGLRVDPCKCNICPGHLAGETTDAPVEGGDTLAVR